MQITEQSSKNVMWYNYLPVIYLSLHDNDVMFTSWIKK